MQVADIHRPGMLSQKIGSEDRARGEIHGRSSRGYIVGCEQRAAIQFKVGRDTSAGGENPFEAYRIHAPTVGGVSALKHDKRRDRVQRQFEASVEKAGAMRSLQNPPIPTAAFHTLVSLVPPGTECPPPLQTS